MDVTASGSAGSAASSGFQETPPTTGILDDLRAHFARYVVTVSESDLDVLALWTVHTHLATECYTTPRLLLDSPMPGSGKTTVLDHLARLAHDPVMAASLSSPAMLARLLADGPRTILIDEADRSLDKDKEGVGDLLAVLNSGYRRGGQRPVLVPDREQGWATREMSTYGPVAMAGNSPNLPADTRSRCIRVLLMPDLDEQADESDWELIEQDVRELAARVVAWADLIRDQVRTSRPTLPEGIRGRNREKWAPLARIAHAAGAHWPTVVNALALADLEQQQADRDEGLTVERPHVQLLRHLAQVWPDGQTFMSTETLLARLAAAHPDEWGTASPFGKPLTSQRAGRMLSRNFSITTSRPNTNGPRGYALAHLEPMWRRLHIPPPGGLRGTG